MNKENLKLNILGLLIGGVTAIIVIIIFALFISFLYKDCCMCGVGNGCCSCPPNPNSELCFHNPEHEDCRIDTSNTEQTKEGEDGTTIKK